MLKKIFHNPIFFPHQQVKCISGAIPDGIQGRFFRNGPATLSYDKKNILTHWFGGVGGLLKLQFNQGKCYSQYSEVDVPLGREREKSKKFEEMFLSDILLRKDVNLKNPANTSVHPMKQGPHVLALCQAGSPYVMSKNNLEMIGWNDYDWIKSGFSAHPKVDPDTGDIFNVGTNFQKATVTISQSDMNLKLKQSTNFKLRKLQSIHDVCLAGDYIVIFQCSMAFSFWKLITKSRMCGLFNFDKNLPTLVHIYSKKDLSPVKQFQMDPFMFFHFSNGYSNDKEIVVQYCRYDAKDAEHFHSFLAHVPKYTQGFDRHFPVKSHLQQLRVDLKTFEFTTKRENKSVEFPIVHDELVGKEWETTYMTHSSKNNFIFDTLASYNRKTGDWTLNELGDEVYLNEPVIVPAADQDYLLAIVNRDTQSYAEIFDSKTLERTCQIELPESVPPGFHGKWDNQL